jgi:hypothetical protein
MMKRGKPGFFLWILLLAPALPLRGEVFQWTDSRGIIHFTDNLHSVPQFLRGSPHLIIREDLGEKETASESSPRPEFVSKQPILEPKAPEKVTPSEPEPTKVTPPVVHYNPQYFNVVVVNSIVRPTKNRGCPPPQGCRSVFRPNFDDRRYIHPSVFNGGSRQYIHPESSQSPRR